MQITTWSFLFPPLFINFLADGAYVEQQSCQFSYYSSSVRSDLFDSSLPSKNIDLLEAIKVPHGTSFRMVCVNEDYVFRDFNTNQIEYECQRGRLESKVSKQIYNQQLDCISSKSTRPEPAKLVRNGTCEKNATSIDVIVTSPISKKSYKLYSVCFDENTSTTLYSKGYVDGKSLSKGLAEIGKPRPKFQDKEGFFPFNVDLAYKQTQEEETLTNLLGEEMFLKYIPGNQYFFSRGHLLPNADPIYKYEKDATFFYVNAVPQWQILNAGNWEKVERSVRSVAEKLGSEIKVWTGTHDVLQLQDSNNNLVEVWMGLDNDETEAGQKRNSEKSKKRLPVPKLLWKVVYSEAENAAVALAQFNNPWAKVTKKDLLCEDICDQLNWILLERQQRHNTKRGYTFCCDLNSLSTKIPTIPKLRYAKILNTENSSEEDSTDEDEDDELI